MDIEMTPTQELFHVLRLLILTAVGVLAVLLVVAISYLLWRRRKKA